MKRLLQFTFLAFVSTWSYAASSDQLALARDVIRLMGIDTFYDDMAPQVQKFTARMMQEAMKQQGFTNEEGADFAKAQEQITAIAMERFKSIVPAMEVAYAEVYTEVELKAMKSFFSTQEGQSMLKKRPEVMNKINPAMQDATLAVQPKVQLLIQREIDRIVAGRKKKNANQALEPTSTAVTPPASAGDRASGTRGSP